MRNVSLAVVLFDLPGPPTSDHPLSENVLVRRDPVPACCIPAQSSASLETGRDRGKGLPWLQCHSSWLGDVLESFRPPVLKTIMNRNRS